MISIYMWIYVGAFLLFVELFTADFLFASLGISCLIASIVAFLGGGIVVQAVVFGISAIVIFLLTRSYNKDMLNSSRHSEEGKTKIRE